MFVIVKETWLASELDKVLRILPDHFSRGKELSFLNMTSVNFQEFPVVTIGLHHSGVLDGGIDVTHVFETPKTGTDCLCDWKTFLGKW